MTDLALCDAGNTLCTRRVRMCLIAKGEASRRIAA
jgi:hypothetical protein